MARRLLAVPAIALLLIMHPITTAADHQPPQRQAQQIDTQDQVDREMTVLTTAYSYTGSKTKTGTWPAQGRTIAVDPNVIPLGSVVEIDGHRYLAEDTGGLIKRKWINGKPTDRIDIYVSRAEDAREYGAQRKLVRIIGGLHNGEGQGL